MDKILYIIVVMIIYDFSLHIYDLLHEYKITKARHPLGAYKVFDYFSKGDKEKWKKVYQIFWTIYWGTASLFVVIYLFASLTK